LFDLKYSTRIRVICFLSFTSGSDFGAWPGCRVFLELLRISILRKEVD